MQGLNTPLAKGLANLHSNPNQTAPVTTQKTVQAGLIESPTLHASQTWLACGRPQRAGLDAAPLMQTWQD